MKRIVLLISIVAVMLSGCKSHKETVVNVRPEFNAEEVWQLGEMKGKEVVFLEGQKKITIQINPEAGTFSGCSGCNRYFGNFKDLGDGKMVLSDFNGTKMACPEAFHKMENNYMQLLQRCDGFNLSEYSLELMQGEKVLLTFEKIKD
ncbi:MAG: META domain-containing protein [Bacteroidales bacterium]|nr:META domain-containing protein [Bacteroidales bacterium]